MQLPFLVICNSWFWHQPPTRRAKVKKRFGQTQVRTKDSEAERMKSRLAEKSFCSYFCSLENDLVTELAIRMQME